MQRFVTGNHFIVTSGGRANARKLLDIVRSAPRSVAALTGMKRFVNTAGLVREASASKDCRHAVARGPHPSQGRHSRHMDCAAGWRRLRAWVCERTPHV